MKGGQVAIAVARADDDTGRNTLDHHLAETNLLADALDTLLERGPVDGHYAVTGNVQSGHLARPECIVSIRCAVAERPVDDGRVGARGDGNSVDRVFSCRLDRVGRRACGAPAIADAQRRDCVGEIVAEEEGLRRSVAVEKRGRALDFGKLEPEDIDQAVVRIQLVAVFDVIAQRAPRREFVRGQRATTILNNGNVVLVEPYGRNGV